MGCPEGSLPSPSILQQKLEGAISCLGFLQPRTSLNEIGDDGSFRRIYGNSHTTNYTISPILTALHIDGELLPHYGSSCRYWRKELNYESL